VDSVKDDLVIGTWVKKLPLHSALSSNLQSSASPNLLKYYGGKVIPNAKVYSVNWNGTVNSSIRSRMPQFYAAILNSPHIDWLNEYDTAGRVGQDGQPGSNQHIGRGTLGGDFTLTPSLTGTTLDDSQI